MIPKVYFDEAGNTGSNITNGEQPYFVLSAVSIWWTNVPEARLWLCL